MSQVTMILRNRRLMLSLTMIVGFLILVQTFFPTPEGKGVYDEITYMNTVIMSFFAFSGAAQLFKYHVPIIVEREKYWQVNAWSVFCALAILVLGLAYGVESPFVDLVLYRGVMTTVAKVMTAAQAWIAASVVMKYTSFRNPDLAAFSLGIFCVIIFQTPILVAIAPQLYDVVSWMRVNIAGNVSIIIKAGLAFGVIAVSVRTLLGQETGFLGRIE